MRNLGWANAGIGLVVQWYHSKVSMFIFVVIRWLLQILPLYPLSRQEVGKKTTNGELVVLLAKSVILLREFSRGFQTFFFSSYISLARPVSSNYPYLKGGWEIS